MRAANTDAPLTVQRNFRLPHGLPHGFQPIIFDLGHLQEGAARGFCQTVMLHDPSIGKHGLYRLLFFGGELLRSDLHPTQLMARSPDHLGRGEKDAQ